MAILSKKSNTGDVTIPDFNSSNNSMELAQKQK
jgi:hypothetical protein